MYKYCLAIISALLLIAPEVKADPKIASNGSPAIKIQYLGIEKGLSNNAVTSIYQDRRGFMWVGTYDGLNRYDGYDFLVYRNQPGDSTTLINNRIVSIYEKGDGLWVGTKKGLSVYNYLTGTFENSLLWDAPSNSFEKILQSINQITGTGDTVFVATGGKGLLYKLPGESFARRIAFSRNGISVWDYHAQAIEFDQEGNVWVFVQGHGIFKLDRGSNLLEFASNVTESANCMVSDKDSNLWIGTDSGLLRYSPKDISHRFFPQSITRHKITDLMYLQEEEEIWVATDGNGVSIYDILNDSFSSIKEGRESTDLTSNSVYALFEDTSARKWLGTLRGGINVVERDNLQFWTVAKNSQSDNSMVSNFILSFCEEEEDRIWIGTDGEGVSLWDRKNNSFTNFTHSSSDPRSLPNNFVTAILKDQKGVWVGTYGGGVSRYSDHTGEFVPYLLHNKKTGYYQNNIWVLYEDSRERIWAATSDGEGLYRYNRLTDNFEFVDAGISGIISMKEDKEGNLWAGTFEKLIKMDLQSFRHLTFEIGYPVREIVFTNPSEMLLGTEGGGLIHFDALNGIKTTYTEKEGLPNNSVLKILKDDNGYYWLSTYNGLAKLNLRTGSLVNYHASDGLQSNQFNYNAGLKLSTGELMFGGIKGFNIITPATVPLDRRAPELLITNVKVNNVPLERSGVTAFAQNKLELPYNKSMLTMDFVALEYSTPDKISYAYYLEGWDRDWHYVGSTRVANYSKLEEGNYTFKVKSTNADGIWSDKVTAMSITILPPWYRTPWAYALYVFAGTVLLLGVVVYQRKQSHLRFKVRLSEEMAQKEKELNEKKLAFFTNISHEFRSPLTMIINPLKDFIYGKKEEMTHGEIEVVYRNSKRLLSLIDQLLLFRKTESEIGELKLVRVDLRILAEEVFSCFVHHAKSKKISYKWTAPEREYMVYADRQKIEISLFNLISNALKFTGKENGLVEVSLAETEGEMVLSVADNGDGLSSIDKEKVFELFYQAENSRKTKQNGFGIGLYLVSKFIQTHSGRVTCADNPMGGTTFSIHLPKGKEHFKGLLIHEELHEHAVFLEELIGDIDVAEKSDEGGDPILAEWIEGAKVILVVDDNRQIREYLSSIFSGIYRVVEAADAEEGMASLQMQHPDLILSDVVMGGMNGVEFCKLIKSDEQLKHIPVVLLTASHSEEIKLKGIEVGADDYITKPFDKEYLMARVHGILKHQETVKGHVFNTVTQKTTTSLKLSEEDKRFVDGIISVIESNLDDRDFNIKVLAEEMAMSHSLLYRKLKQITGKSLNELIRLTRLRKVASLLINSEMQVNEAAFSAGFSDLKYFRKQFQQVYEMNPSEFQKKYKNALVDKQYTLSEKFWRQP
ncbi:MAG TPA: two-component regulator propeller domain-containing protein [Cyclobacteriaceae bacterium]|nr:two-component regulator propeller domain-containing protein [Cyclobacteriaceae bacterium]